MVQEKKYKSGMRLIVNENPNSRSVSFNMYVKVGSADELEVKDYGISHMIEHMLFKSTNKRSSTELNNEFDKIGADINAYTDCEETNYHVKTIKPYLEKCVLLLSEMYFDHKFDETELETERKVILEELITGTDEKEDVALDKLIAAIYKQTSYKHPIIGFRETVETIKKEDLEAYFKKHYQPQNLILSFSGNITMEEAQKLAENYFQKHFKQISLPNYAKLDNQELPVQKARYQKTKVNKEQSTVYIAIPVSSIYDKENLLTNMTNAALSIGGNSPLFEKVREDKGYVYDIYSFVNNYKVGGAIIINFSTQTKNVVNAVKVIKELLDDIKQNGFTQERLDVIKAIEETNTQFTLEDNVNLATLQAKTLAKFNKLVNLDESADKIKAVTLEELNQKAKQIFSNENVIISYIGKPISENLLDVFLGREKETTQEQKQDELTK